jgi:predicted NUDIX family NTP pyrophosphohydrolase
LRETTLAAVDSRKFKAMAKTSAGILMYRRRGETMEVFLIHPGGPYSKNKDAGAWSIPKGEVDPGEEKLAAARREFREETGFAVEGEFIELPVIKQKGGKVVSAWAVEGDIDHTQIHSNTFMMEWPPRSGQMMEFPEVDKAAWFGLSEARAKIIDAQFTLVTSLCAHLGVDCS